MFRHTLIAVGLLVPVTLAHAAGWEPARSTGNKPTTALPDAPVQQTAAQPLNDITAPLRQAPPPAPPSEAEAWAISQAAPFNKQEGERIAQAIDSASRGRAWQAADVVPRISTQTVNLSPGASMPVLRTAVNQASTIMFTDNSGAPWPLAAAPYNSNDKGFNVEFIPDSSVLTVQAIRQYDRGNVTAYLQGLPVPVIISVSSGEADNESRSRTIDGRLDLRIPRRGPLAKNTPTGQAKIDLNNPTLQAFLDGVPPENAQRLKVQGNVPDTQVWQIGDELYVRTRSDLRDRFELTLASGDGTVLYKLPLAPELAFSVAGKTTWLTVFLE